MLLDFGAIPDTEKCSYYATNTRSLKNARDTIAIMTNSIEGLDCLTIVTKMQFFCFAPPLYFNSLNGSNSGCTQYVYTRNLIKN